MADRVAVISIIVENPDSVEPLNALLHEYGSYIIGRMGLPYPKRGINIIAIAADAPEDVIVENVHLSESLMALSYKLSQYRNEHTEK